MIEPELLSIKTILVKVIMKVGQEKNVVDSVLKNSPCTYKIKDINGEK